MEEILLQWRENMLYWLSQVPYGSYFWEKYVFSVLILIVAAVGAKLLLVIFEKYLHKFARKTKTEIDDLIFDKTKKPLFYFVLVLGLKFSLLNLSVNGTVNKIVNSLTAVVFVFLLARIVGVVIEAWGKSLAKRTESEIDDVLMPLFHKFTKIVFVIIALLWVLDIWQVNITPYLAGAGIAGLVIGFALQDLLKNVFGGVTLLLDKTFKVGDKVKLESGEVGEILDIGLRSTKITTYDHELIYVPNGYLANSRVLNYTRPTVKVRVTVEFGVVYGSKVGDVQKTVLNVIRKMENVLAEPKPVVQFLKMGSSSLDFAARFWVAKWDVAFDKKLEATEKIYNALNKAKIELAFPTQTVYVKKED
ncbi:MAG: mechanosensitive ion channel family protein [Nanoarchaeota archaeon]